MRPSPETSAASKIPVRPLWQSTTVLTLTLCLAIYLSSFLISWQSLLSAQMPQWIVNYTESTANFLMSKKKPQIVVLGSSLALCGFSRNAKVPAEPVADRRLEDRAIPPVTLLASPGMLMSDENRLTQTLLYKTRQKPDLLILTYSYRDFQDNMASEDLDQTPVCKMLDYSQSDLHFVLHPWDLLNTKEWHDFFSSHRGHYQAVAKLLRQNILDIASSRLAKGAPAQAATPVALSTTATPHKSTNIAEYQKRYLPPNKKQYDLQMQNLEAILQTAQEENVPVVLVNMPITAANRNLIGFDWQGPVRALAKTYKVEVGDFDSEPLRQGLSDAHFSDSVHVDGVGQPVFEKSLTHWLKQTSAYKRAFAGN